MERPRPRLSERFPKTTRVARGLPLFAAVMAGPVFAPGAAEVPKAPPAAVAPALPGAESVPVVEFPHPEVSQGPDLFQDTSVGVQAAGEKIIGMYNDNNDGSPVDGMTTDQMTQTGPSVLKTYSADVAVPATNGNVGTYIQEVTQNPDTGEITSIKTIERVSKPGAVGKRMGEFDASLDIKSTSTHIEKITVDGKEVWSYVVIDSTSEPTPTGHQVTTTPIIIATTTPPGSPTAELTTSIRPEEVSGMMDYLELVTGNAEDGVRILQ